MSSNENDAFDTLMNEFTQTAALAAEASPGTDTPATVAIPEPEVEVEAAPVEVQEATEEVETADTAPEQEQAEDTPEEVETPASKAKQTAQERIREVVAKQREAERALAAREAELEALKRRLDEVEAAKPKQEAEKVLPAGTEFGLVEPTADDLDANGEPKYPLGTFDPTFMRDLNRYDRAVERAYEAKIAEQREAQTAEQLEAQKLFESWEVKLNEAEKTSPNLRTKAQELVDTFTDAEPQHMQTLAQTIMQLDNGPAVLEYLADNLDVADNLVKMSTPRALLQLGRFDGLLAPEAAVEITPVKPTSAPRPPATLSRGQGGTKVTPTSLYDKMLKDFR